MESTMCPSDITWELFSSSEATKLPSQELFGTTDKVLQSLSLALIMLGTLLFNTFTIFIILRVRSLRNVPHNLLILNLAIADLGLVVCNMVFSLVSIFDNGYFLSCHRKICKVQGFLAITVSFTILPTILSIAVDRLLILVFSRYFQPNRTRVLFMVVACWLVGAIVASVSVTRRDRDAAIIGFHPGTLHCSMAWWESDSFRINVIILNYGLFIPSLFGCYVWIIYHLWKEERRLNSHSVSRANAACKVIMPSAVTEDAKSKLDADVSQTQGEGNGDWIFLHGAISDQDRVVESGDTNTNHHLQSEEVTTTETKARKNRLKVERRKHMAHKRVAKMAILLVLAVVTCWTPYFLFHSRLIPGYENARVGVFTMWMGFCNALIDPLIYAFVNRCVRAEMHRVLRNIRRNVFSVGTKFP